MLASLLAAATAASFSRSVYSPLAALSLALLLAAALKVDVRRTLKAAGAVAAFAIAMTLPMASYRALLDGAAQGGFAEGLASLMASAALPPLLRAVAAAALLAVMAQRLGLTGLIRGLGGLGLPSRALFLLAAFIRYVPIMLREAARQLSAREARLVRGGVRSSWLALSTVAGGLLTRGYDRALKLQAALRARGLDHGLAPRPSGRLGPLDLAFVASMSALSLALVLV